VLCVLVAESKDRSLTSVTTGSYKNKGGFDFRDKTNQNYELGWESVKE
jgi:hypothetical protein